MKSWMLRALMLVLGCGLVLTGARMLKNAQVRSDIECHGVDPADGARIYQQRMEDTDRLLRGDEDISVSWHR
ncbi:MAG: hypothetical protein R6X12_05980 [bacterium]